MTAIVIDHFGGLAPRVDPQKLPEHGAQSTLDVRLHSGALRGWRKPLVLSPTVTVPVTTKTIFYDPGSTAWFYWDVDVDVVPGPVADLTAQRRYYYTGDTEPRKTDSAMAIAGTGAYPRTYYHMGVPAPTDAATASAGTDALVRVWVYTNVSEFSGIEEESGPSPPVTISTWASGNTITLSAMTAIPTTGYNITKRRLYRSAGSDYLFVKEFTGTSTTDNVLDADLGEPITTLLFDEPPAGLTGLISMTNGFLAGFVGNQVYFSEAYQPHAWPASYSITVSEQIIALAPVAQGCYVLTEGSPHFVTGVSPDGMTGERINKYAPCLSKRSVATDGSGVLYATYNGVAYLSGGDVKTLTEQLFTQEEWGAYGPENMFGIFYDERYTLWFA